MVSTFALQTLRLRTDAAPRDLETVFETEILPESANALGTVDRGGRSIIASQHLLGLNGRGTEYLWIIKWSGAFSLDRFREVVEQISQDAAGKLDGICERTSMSVWTQVQSYDAGPRDALGSPSGAPRIDVSL